MLINQVLLSTIRTIQNNKLSFLRLSYIPIACFLIVDIWLLQTQSKTMFIVGILLNIYIYTIFCIGIHRINLIGKKANHPLGNIRLKLREFNYIGYLLIIGLITGFAKIVVLFPIIGQYLALLLVIYLFSRLVLVLPAVAIERSFSLKQSLLVTKEYHLEAFILLGVIPTLTILPLYLLDHSLFSQIISSVYTTVIMIFNVSLISQTYEKIVGSGGDEESVSVEI